MNNEQLIIKSLSAAALAQEGKSRKLWVSGQGEKMTIIFQQG